MRYFCLIVAAMLLLCLAPMPYGYYMLLRFVSMICFGLLAYQYFEREQPVLMVTFGALALLFQPFFKIALGRNHLEYRGCSRGYITYWDCHYKGEVTIFFSL